MKNKELDGRTSHPDVRFSQASVLSFFAYFAALADFALALAFYEWTFLGI
jgi:hypothetical protein